MFFTLTYFFFFTSTFTTAFLITNIGLKVIPSFTKLDLEFMEIFKCCGSVIVHNTCNILIGIR